MADDFYDPGAVVPTTRQVQDATGWTQAEAEAWRDRYRDVTDPADRVDVVLELRQARRRWRSR